MIQNLSSSNRVFSSGTPTERTIARLYSGCLGRNPTGQESQTLLTGPELALGLFSSKEFQRTSRFPALIFPLIRHAAPEFLIWKRYRDQVIDAGNRASLVQDLFDVPEQFEEALADADKAPFSPQTEAFLLYATLLQRESSPQERNLRASQLSKGYLLRDLIRDFVEGAEFQSALHLDEIAPKFETSSSRTFPFWRKPRR